MRRKWEWLEMRYTAGSSVQKITIHRWCSQRWKISSQIVAENPKSSPWLEIVLGIWKTCGGKKFKNHYGPDGRIHLKVNFKWSSSNHHISASSLNGFHQMMTNLIFNELYSRFVACMSLRNGQKEEIWEWWQLLLKFLSIFCLVG